MDTWKDKITPLGRIEQFAHEGFGLPKDLVRQKLAMDYCDAESPDHFYCNRPKGHRCEVHVAYVFATKIVKDIWVTK
jgi:hypothetical protein